MTADANEDLSMEEILSSIRNILMEEPEESVVEKPESINEPLKIDDDILNLSEDMLVKDDLVNLEPEMESVPVMLEEPEPVFVEPEQDPVSEDNDDIDTFSDPIYEELETPVNEAVIEDKVEDFATQAVRPEEVKPEAFGEDVSAKILNDFEQIFEEDRQAQIISDVAREEIAKQAKDWLDKNMPSLVMETVKKEISRVMAKVGQ